MYGKMRGRGKKKRKWEVKGVLKKCKIWKN
jgi:hypothetical protein